MNVHRVETVLIENGTLTLRNLPFQEGDAVEVIILEHRSIQGRDPKHHSDLNSYPLRGKVIRYDDPTEPVAVEDWEVLQ